MRWTGLKGVSPSLAAALLAGVASAAADARAARDGEPDAGVDPLALYGPEIGFEVLRNGDKVGFHRVALARRDGEIVVHSTFSIEIEFLFFTAYRYLYSSVVRWRDGRMIDLTARIDDDGEVETVRVVSKGERLWIQGPHGETETRAPLFPTNHWNHRVVGQNRVLNTLNGEVTPIRIEPQGREAVQTERGPVMATRYRYVGDIDTEVWYDDLGRWVRMRFPGTDGSVIDYRCVGCQGGQASEAAR